MEKGFFKVFSPVTSAKHMKIPPGFRDYKNGKLPKKVSLRDRLGNMWPIGVTKIGRDIYFQYGWPKFIKDNNLELGDFLIFDFDGNIIFDFKLLGINGCEKKEARGLKLVVIEEGDEMNVEHQKSAEPKGKNWASDSSSSSSSDDSDKDSLEEEEEEETYDETEKVPCSKYRDLEEEEDDEEKEESEEEEEEEKEETKKAPHSKRRHMEEEEYTDEEEEEEEETEEEEEEENERPGTFKNKASRLKAGWKRATASKVSDLHDPFGADIFKSGHATQPKNPYFVAKVQPKRKNRLYVPVDVLRDYKLELPSTMTIRDSAGREFETKVANWKDGRIWLVGGWRSLCRWNLVEKNDKCICEFVREKGNTGLYLQVNILHEGASSHPNQKNKK